MRRSLALAALLVLIPAAGIAHEVTVDGDPQEWMTRLPKGANLGIVARDAKAHGEYVWSDASGDTRTDLSVPEVVADIVAFQVTGSPTQLSFLLRRQPGTVFTGAPIQVQIAIAMGDATAPGQTYLAAYADTKVADANGWVRLVQTLFGSGGAAQVIDTSFNKVADAQAVQGAGGEVEISLPWTALGLFGPPQAPLRFTVATFRAQSNDLSVDIGGSSVSNALDCISDYGDPSAANFPNTWAEVQDQVVDYAFDVWFDSVSGEVYSPLVVDRFLANPFAGTSDEWYAVRNVSPATLALDQFKIGNEATPDGSKGMFTFPAGASLASGAAFVVARDGAAYQTFFGNPPDAELPPGTSASVPDMIPFLPWTNGVPGSMQLSGAGGDLLVLAPANTVLDLVAFGSGAYPGITPIAPAPGASEVLVRTPPSQDTDDCGVDFVNAGAQCAASLVCGACRGCELGVCTASPAGSSCADANLCNGAETCDGSGACIAGTPPDCSDHSVCTSDSCDPATGCTHTAANDGQTCSGDGCAPGTCAGGKCTCLLDAGAPGPDAAAPGPDAAGPGFDAASSGPDATSPGSDASAPGRDAAIADASPAGPDATPAGPDAAAEGDAAVGEDATSPQVDAAAALDVSGPQLDAMQAERDATAEPGRDAAARPDSSHRADATQGDDTGGGCGCVAASNGGPMASLGLVLALALLRRRRKG